MDLADIRHKLHMIPELSFREYKTQAFIEGLLDSLGVPYEEVAGTGILARWEFGDGPFRLFRADMDALPVVEDTGWEFSSGHEGIMHACGHDVHMTVLIGLIERVILHRAKENLLFLFQPAEEAGGGAERCMESLERFSIHEAWALHVNDEYPEGSVSSRPGVLFASAYEVDCIFEGRSAHVAFYKQGLDAVEGATDFLREVYRSPREDTVLRFGMISGGRVRNVVPDSCVLYGTIRTPDYRLSESAVEELADIGNEIASNRGLIYSQTVGSRYPQLNVNEELYEKLRHLVEVNTVEMKYVGEDFSFIALKYPSLLFWLGTGREDPKGLHNSQFLPADSVIEKGVDVFWRIVTG